MLSRVASFCVTAAAMLLVASPASAAEVLYGADGSGANPSNLYVLDPATGAVISTVGPIGFAVTGLADDPVTDVLYGTTTSGTGRLITINKTTGAGTDVGDLLPAAAGTAPDITFTPDGTLYGFITLVNDLATIDRMTGEATIVGDSGVTGHGGFGLASSTAGTLFLAAGDANGPLRTVNRMTGATTDVATMNGGGNPIGALAFNAAGTLFGVVRGGQLVTINTTTAAVTVVGPSVSGLDAIEFDAGPPPPPPSPPPAPGATPAVGGATSENPRCKRLRSKLKRQRNGRERAETEPKRELIAGNIEKTQRRFEKLGCK